MAKIAASIVEYGWTNPVLVDGDNGVIAGHVRLRVMRHKGKIGQDIDHPAVFPVALPEHIMEAFSSEGDVVFEPFNGSGTSLLAAQRTGRQCRAVEIAPEYVDVAIRRFRQNNAGVAVTLAATGQAFAEVAAERLGVEEHAHA